MVEHLKRRISMRNSIRCPAQAALPSVAWSLHANGVPTRGTNHHGSQSTALSSPVLPHLPPRLSLWTGVIDREESDS